MAIPPEPIEEVLPEARWIVEAEVEAIVETAAGTPEPARPAGFVGPGKAPRQVVKLRVRKVLRGDGVPDLLEVVKPEAGYSLRAGNRGPFLLDGSAPRPHILGRYGPDTWPYDTVATAAGQ